MAPVSDFAPPPPLPDLNELQEFDDALARLPPPGQRMLLGGTLPWSRSVCSCCSSRPARRLCTRMTFCAPCVYGGAVARATGGSGVAACLCFYLAGPWYRTKIRDAYGVQGAACSDYLCHMAPCVCCCAKVQDVAEVEKQTGGPVWVCDCCLGQDSSVKPVELGALPAQQDMSPKPGTPASGPRGRKAKRSHSPSARALALDSDEDE